MNEKERKAFEAGFFAGFKSSGEGWNGEYGSTDDPMDDESLKEALAAALERANATCSPRP